MIDASACDLRDPIDRNRKDSMNSIVMNEQYRQMQNRGKSPPDIVSRACFLLVSENGTPTNFFPMFLT